MVAIFIILAVLAVIGFLAVLGMAPQNSHVGPQALHPMRQRPVAAEGQFNCRVTIRSEQAKNSQAQLFCVEIKGVINAPSDNHDTKLRLTIDDTTEQGAEPVRCNAARYQKDGSGAFLYEEPNGKLPRQQTELANWVTVASLPVGMFSFAKKGARKLVFRVALVSCETGESLAAARTQVVYENENLGFLDATVNVARTQQHGVTLALAVAIADDDVAESELDVIRNWAASKLAESNNGEFVPDIQLERQLEKALHQALKFFSSGGRIDIRALCNEIVSLAPEPERFELMRLCIAVAKADGEVTEREMEVLNRLGMWLVLDRGKIRQMMEQLMPADLSGFKNIDAALGITNDMDPELIRKYLNEEYRRWNARVTNSDPNVRKRAESVLGMIAQARQKYVREQTLTALHTLTERPQAG
jgi:tellurite resistance protein